jgi:hypothetical protein
MNVIHKQKLPVFENPLSDVITLQFPPFAKILKIARQYPHDPSPYVWYICNPKLAATEPVQILMVGTGHEFPATVSSGYLGTEIFHNGQLVLHFFLMED